MKIKVFSIVFSFSVCFVYFFRLFNEKRESDSFMYHAINDFNKGVFGDAINGNDFYAGFFETITKFKNRDVANTAKLYGGISLIKLKKYEDGIEYLLKSKIKDKIIEAKVSSFIGDAYVELGKFGDAINYYDKSLKILDDEEEGSRIVFKKVLIFEKFGKYSEAMKLIDEVLKKKLKKKMVDKFKIEKKRIKLILENSK